MLVRSRMTSSVITASPWQSVAEALQLCRTHRIRHLPIVDGGRLAGLVTDRDLRLAMPPMWADEHEELQALLHRKTVADMMVTDLVTVDPDTPMEAAARLLYERRIGCLPVLEGEELVGILTETDVLRVFVEMFGARPASSRIEVRMPNRPGELARVVRLIGIEKRINISGLVVPPVAGGESVAIMQVGTVDPEPLMESLRKMGYDVGCPALDMDDDSILEPPPAPPRGGGQVPVEL
jgi:acetoin utilization protein AcuB